MFPDPAKALLSAIVQGSRGAAWNQHDASNRRVNNDLYGPLPTSSAAEYQASNDLYTLPTRFDEAEFGQMVGEPKMVPGVRPAMGGFYDDYKDGMAEYDGQYGDLPYVQKQIAAQGPAAAANLVDQQNRQRSQAEIAAGDAEIKAGRDQIAGAEDLLARTIRGEVPFTERQFPEVGKPFGMYDVTPLTPGGTNAMMDDMLKRKDNAIMERGGIGADGRRIPLGQMPGEFATTQRVGLVGAPAAKNPNRYTNADDGLPGGPTAFGPVMPSRNGLASSMSQYSKNLAAQRERLAARGKNPEQIAHLMGGPRPGPDLSVVRAVNQANMQSGLGPRLSASLALDAGGGAAQGSTTMALRDAIVGGEPMISPIQTAQAGVLGAQQKLLEQELKNKQNPIAEAENKVNAEIKQRELAARGMTNDATIDPISNPETQQIFSSDYIAGKPLDPRMDEEFRNFYNSDEYDNYSRGWWNLGGLLGGAGFTPQGKEDVWVEGVRAKYPKISEQAARKWYRENLKARTYTYLQ